VLKRAEDVEENRQRILLEKSLTRIERPITGSGHWPPEGRNTAARIEIAEAGEQQASQV
jgi:hypothetical protein